MTAPAMAMFPLGTVLLPGGVLPLHVFEPRYRALVRDCLAADGEPEFGQVLITRGRETGGGDERADVGTIAQMLHVEALDDGRYALVAVGTRRIRVERWRDDDPYPRADVVDWPDDGTVPEQAAIDAAHERVREVLRLAAEVDRAERGPGSDEVSPPDVAISTEPVLATYHLATLAPIGPADRYRLLAVEDAVRRLEMLDEILDDVEAMMRFRLA